MAAAQLVRGSHRFLANPGWDSDWTLIGWLVKAAPQGQGREGAGEARGAGEAGEVLRRIQSFLPRIWM
jgi:hypothetical protein